MNSSVYNNKEIIGNIRDCTSDKTLTVYTNGGSNNFAQMTPFKLLPMEVHLKTDSMSSIIVIKDVS